MAISNVAHLERRGHSFYFRRAIPRAFAPLIQCREIRRTLGTRDLPLARLSRCRMQLIASLIIEYRQIDRVNPG